MRRPGSLWVVTASLAAILLLPAAAFAAGGGISGSLGIAPMGSGDAGNGFDRPEYADAFETGGILRVEPYYDFTPMIRGQAGFAHAKWDGDTYHGVTFGDLKMDALYAGVRFRFLPGKAIRPYAVADLGFARLGSVSVAGLHGAGQTRYWDSTETVYLDLGGGCEFEITPKLSFFADVRLMATGEPDSDDAPFSDADGVGSMPFSAGVSYKF
jgi:hypothetical protein